MGTLLDFDKDKTIKYKKVKEKQKKVYVLGAACLQEILYRCLCNWAQESEKYYETYDR